MQRIALSSLGDGKIFAKPETFLADGFNSYISATKAAGAVYDRTLKGQVAPMSSLRTMVDELRKAKFEVVIDSSLKAKIEEKAKASQAGRDAASRRILEVNSRYASKGIKVKDFQVEGIRWLAARDRAVLADQMGCVSGSAVIQVGRAGKEFEISLEDLYSKFHGLAGRWRRDVPTTVKALCDGALRQHRIVNVLDKGIKPVVEIRLASGKTIRVTPDHEIAAADGSWVAAESLLIGQKVLTNGADSSCWPAGTDKFLPVEDAVTDVVHVGDEHVYDIVCGDPHRNFVANGIVVHNCGKTIQVLLSLPDNCPVIVICPVVAKGVWEDEVTKWRPDLKVTVLKGRKSFRVPQPNEVVVLNYDILPSQRSEAKEGLCMEDVCKELLPGTVLVADEHHQCKSSKALKTQRFRVLSRACHKVGGRVWLVTGTPLLNRPPELWCLLQNGQMTQTTFGTWPRMVDLFNGVPGQWGGYEWGTPRPEVAELLKNVMLRRRRDDVMSQMAKSTIQYVNVDINDKKVEASINKLNDAINDMMEKRGITLEQALDMVMAGGMPGFEDISRVRMAIAAAKTPSLIELVEEYEEEEEPLVVFSAHRAPVEAVGSRPGWACITGSTSEEDRARIQHDFQNGRLKGVALTIKAGGVAITLTRSCQTLFCDLEWVPGLNEQAMFRVDRIGQTKPVVHKIVQIKHPLEYRINSLLIEKQDLISATVEAAADINRDFGLVHEDEALMGLLESGKVVVSSRQAEAYVTPKAAPEAPRSAPAPTEYGPEVKVTRLPSMKPRRAPNTPVERWAARGLEQMCAMDQDHARDQNGMGFNKTDSGFGHSLGRSYMIDGKLTEAQWASLTQMMGKYQGQIGPRPKG